MGKKGQIGGLTIGIIVAIVAFILVLVLLYQIHQSVNTDEEACRLSVLERATSPNVAQQQIPLKCTTGKICISESGKSDACNQFAGAKNVVSVKLDGNDADKIKTIEKTSAEAFYSCWTVMGRGKLDLFGSFSGDLGGTQGNTCVICSRVAFADDVPEKLLGDTNVKRYMENNIAPGTGLTYVQVLADDAGTKTFSVFDKLVPPTNEGNEKILAPNGRQTAIVFSQIKQTSPEVALRNLVYTGLSGTVLISKVPIVGTLAGAALKTVPGAIVTVAGASGAAVYTGVNAYLNQQAAAAFCGRFTTSVTDDKLKGGCSLVQAIPYSVPNINAICGSVQGSP